MKCFKDFLNSFFIKEPMRLSYILTVIINLLVLFLYFIELYCNSQINLDTFIISVIVVTPFLLYNILNHFLSKKMPNKPLGGIRQQLKKINGKLDKRTVITLIIETIYYISLVIFWNVLLDNGFSINSTLASFLTGLIVFLYLYRILYLLLKVSPIIPIFTISTPLFISSVIGIESATFGWTFLSIILLTIFTNFTDPDIKYIVPEKYISFLENDEKLKKRLFLIKYYILMYIPMFYISLLISEKISRTNTFIYLVSKISFGHENLESIRYLSFHTLYSSSLKLLFITYSFTLFWDIKEYLLEKIVKKLLNIQESSITHLISKGRNNRFYQKKIRKKWKINRHKQRNLVARNKKITDNPNSNFQKKIIYHSIFIVVTLCIFILVYISSQNNMNNSYRGDYYLLIENKQPEERKQICLNDKLSFCDNSIIEKKIIKNEEMENNYYIYDNVSFTVSNSNNKEVGELDYINKTITIKTDNRTVKKYVLKNSNLYSKYIKKDMSKK